MDGLRVAGGLRARGEAWIGGESGRWAEQRPTRSPAAGVVEGGGRALGFGLPGDEGSSMASGYRRGGGRGWRRRRFDRQIGVEHKYIS